MYCPICTCKVKRGKQCSACGAIIVPTRRMAEIQKIRDAHDSQHKPIEKKKQIMESRTIYTARGKKSKARIYKSDDGPCLHIEHEGKDFDLYFSTRDIRAFGKTSELIADVVEREKR